MTRGENDIKSLVEVAVKTPESMFSGRFTYTSMFLIPAFDIYMGLNLHGLFTNSYIGDADLNHVYSRPLFLLLTAGIKDEESRKAFELEDTALKTNKHYVYTYTVGMNNGYPLYMYVFECPAVFTEDYDKFLAGQYSEFSTHYKERFSKLIPDTQGMYIESPTYGVLFKTPHLKRKIEHIIGQRLEPTQEYFGILEKDYEIFRFTNKPKQPPSINEPFEV